MVHLWSLAGLPISMSPCMCCVPEMGWEGLSICPSESCSSILHFRIRSEDVRENIFPVCVDNINCDKASKPPIVRGRQAGRPPEKRIRHRSECIRPEDSKIKCGQCGQKGHNKRTCKNKEVNLSLWKKERLVRLRVLKGEAISLVSILRKLHVSMVVTRYAYWCTVVYTQKPVKH